MQNVYAIINLDSNTVVAEATHYQEAARVSNLLDAQHEVKDGERYPHTICRIDSLYLHERKYGKLN